jgi:hypothetical protein
MDSVTDNERIAVARSGDMQDELHTLVDALDRLSRRCQRLRRTSLTRLANEDRLDLTQALTTAAGDLRHARAALAWLADEGDGNGAGPSAGASVATLGREP